MQNENFKNSLKKQIKDDFFKKFRLNI